MKPDRIEDIEYWLKLGRVIFGDLRVYIHENKSHRYTANIYGPGFNAVIETPLTVGAEGRLSFCERIAPDVLHLWKKQGAEYELPMPIMI